MENFLMSKSRLFKIGLQVGKAGDQQFIKMLKFTDFLFFSIYFPPPTTF